MSNKYRLIKTYPGSPKLDSIVKLKNNGGYELETSTSYFMTKDKVENYPEFWQPVVEKDYEILSFYNKEGKSYYNITTQGYYYSEPDSSRSFTYCSLYYQIHSVKRLSDGEIFTIGDKIDWGNISKSVLITKIELNRDQIVVFAKYHSNMEGSLPLNIINKSKQKLFTTEDNVDIFEDKNHYFYVNKNWYIDEIHNINKLNYETYHKNKPLFSTKEKAEEYILIHKPCLSLNDIFKDVEKMRKGLKTFENSELAKRFKKLVQQKLNK